MHGEVVNTLEVIFHSNGFETENTQKIDLIAKKDHSLSLIEVKSHSDTQSIYTAIGQLMYHELAFEPPVIKVIVLPHNVKSDQLICLRKLGIKVIRYKRLKKEIRFLDLGIE